MQELHSPPDKRKPFQKNPLSRLRAFGPHEIRRTFRKAALTGYPGHSHRTKKRPAQGYDKQRQFKQIPHIYHVIHNSISIPDHLGEQPGSHKKA